MNCGHKKFYSRVSEREENLIETEEFVKLENDAKIKKNLSKLENDPDKSTLPSSNSY